MAECARMGDRFDNFLRANQSPRARTQRGKNATGANLLHPKLPFWEGDVIHQQMVHTQRHPKHRRYQHLPLHRLPLQKLPPRPHLKVPYNPNPKFYGKAVLQPW